MITFGTVGDFFLVLLNALVYTFWFALLIFVVFILYMTLLTIKVNEKKIKTEERRKEYKKYYQSLLCTAFLIVAIFTSLFITVL